LTYFFQLHYSPGVDSTSNRNEQEVKKYRYRPGVERGFPGVKDPRFLDNGTGWW
jgi:hypothetical protein